MNDAIRLPDEYPLPKEYPRVGGAMALAALQLQRKLKSLLLEDVKVTGKELGSGGYGAVYEVTVSKLVCAAKKPHDILVQDGNELIIEKFGKECLLHSEQRHPNIVLLMGIYFPPNAQLPMLVMEYLPMTLTQCIEKQHDLPIQVRYSILLDVAKGLNYLHCKKPPIVHCDLTSNNILLTSSFVAKISDLGVSRVIGSIRSKRNALEIYKLSTAPGNAIVMPPEALKDNPHYTHKLDVFSYGCLVLFVFTQQWPQPSDEYGIGWFQWWWRKFISKVNEWDRRSKYTAMIENTNPFLPLAKSCLEDDPDKRPDITAAIACAEQSLAMYYTADIISDKAILAHKLDLAQKEKGSLENTMKDVLKVSNKLTEEKQQLTKEKLQLTEEKQQLTEEKQQLTEYNQQLLKKVEIAETRINEALQRSIRADVLTEEWKSAYKKLRNRNIVIFVIVLSFCLLYYYCFYK